MAKTFLQVRTEDKVKEQASLIVEELGTEDEMLEASVESFILEYGKMEALFTRALGWNEKNY